MAEPQMRRRELFKASTTWQVRLRALAGLALLMLPALVALLTSPAIAGNVRIAVATNFAEPARRIASNFSAATGHTTTISTGATGQLYAQIKAGAPFDVFLAADDKRPLAIERERLGVEGTRFTYARGRLVLWSADRERISGDGRAILAAADFRALAIADPKLAPYGEAARDMLQKLGLWQSLQPRLVYGSNIGQSHALVASGNAELGLVALSSIVATKNNVAVEQGSMWHVPAELHAPITQDAVLLAASADNDAARAFLAYLKGPDARAVITTFGYGTDE